jgi:hypothetical protein
VEWFLASSKNYPEGQVRLSSQIYSIHTPKLVSDLGALTQQKNIRLNTVVGQLTLALPQLTLSTQSCSTEIMIVQAWRVL